MKVLILATVFEILLCVFTARTSLARSETVNEPTSGSSYRIVKYDVYPRSARLLIEADVTGDSVILLPSSLSPKNVRPETGLGGAEIISFSAYPGAADYSGVPSYLEKESAEIAALKEKIAVLRNRLSYMRLPHKILSNVNLGAGRLPDTEAYLKTVLILGERASAAVPKAENELADLENKLYAMESNYDKRLPEGWGSFTAVSVKTTAPGKVLFSAVTENAGWSPAYDFKLDSSTGKIEGAMKASAFQATGLAWDGVIELRAYEPIYMPAPAALGPTVAEIAPENVRPAPIAARAGMKLAVRQESANDAARVNAPVFSDGLLGTDIKLPAVLEGNGYPSTVLLKNFEMGSRVRYEITPEYSPYALIIANTDPAPAALPAGKAALYVDGEYAGEYFFREVAKNDSLRISFGAVRAVTAKKIPVISRKTAARRSDATKEGYSVTISNGLSKEIEVFLTDRIPVSGDSRIKIENVSVSPEPESVREGVCTWKLTVPGGGSKTADVSYSITYPAGSEIFLYDGYPGEN